MDAFAADMSAQAEVRRLAARVLDTYPRLDVLVNNVRRVLGPPARHRRQLEHTFALNHLAPFLLTNLLLGLGVELVDETRAPAAGHARRVTEAM